MSARDRLRRLRMIADLVRDQDMARLRKLAERRDITKAKYTALSKPPVLVEDPALFSARQTHLRWAEQQRALLNQTLATQTARVLDQRAKTARSFGRAEALAKLQTKLKP